MSKIQKMLKITEINENNFQNIASLIIQLSEEDFEEFDSKSRENLVKLTHLLYNYLDSSGIIEAFKVKKNLKSISSEISSLSYQLLTSRPVPHVFSDKYQNLKYHELENLAKNQQKMIEKMMRGLDPLKTLLKSRSQFLMKNLEMLKFPSFKLMLFEYNDGLSSYFPHEDSEIEKHKQVMIKEINSQLSMLTKNYGNGSIEKIVKNRAKWDLDYLETAESVKESLKFVHKFKGDVLDDSDIFMKSWARTENFLVFGQEFKEGPVEYCAISQLVNMNLCSIRSSIWPFEDVPEFEVDETQTVTWTQAI
jgi:hypothetical protein